MVLNTDPRHFAVHTGSLHLRLERVVHACLRPWALRTQRIFLLKHPIELVAAEPWEIWSTHHLDSAVNHDCWNGVDAILLHQLLTFVAADIQNLHFTVFALTYFDYFDRSTADFASTREDLYSVGQRYQQCGNAAESLISLELSTPPCVGFIAPPLGTHTLRLARG